MKRAPSTQLAGYDSPQPLTPFEVEESGLRCPKRVKLDQTRMASSAVLNVEDVIQETEGTVTFASGQPSRYESRTVEKKLPRKTKLQVVQQTLDAPHPAPTRWREIYALITSMRGRKVAPVDTMGCQLAQAGETDPVVPIAFYAFPTIDLIHQAKHFSTLVSLMLSSQTKDEVCDAAVKKLCAAVGGSLTVNAILAADRQTISNAIQQVGFWRKKTG